MISYPHYLNYSFLSFLELKKYHLSYQITQITKIVNLFQEQNDKIVTIVTNIIHRFFSFWKKLAHIEPCLFPIPTCCKSIGALDKHAEIRIWKASCPFALRRNKKTFPFSFLPQYKWSSLDPWTVQTFPFFPWDLLLRS